MTKYSKIQKEFETIFVGEALEDLRKMITGKLMMSYGAATWDYAPIHYDVSTARTLGFRGPIADGQMFGAFLIHLVQNWAGHYAYINKLSFQNKNVVYAGDEIICKGYVQEKNVAQRIVVCRLWIENQNNQVILDNGSAVVSFTQNS